MQSPFKASAILLALALTACSNDNSEQKEATEKDAPAAETTDPVAPAADPAAAAEEFKAANLAFLEENKSKEGVLVTESGLQYKILTPGDGAQPTNDDYVTVHYAGRLIDGSEFDSSYERGAPNTFAAGRLIKGWTEALTMMKVGAKWQLTIPSDLGYGPRGAGAVIPANATLVFDVELLDIKTEEEAEAEETERRKAARAKAREAAEAQLATTREEGETYLEHNAKQEGVMVTDSGLQYRIIQSGAGDSSPTATSNVTVHYAGKLIDGTEFDSSYKRGSPSSFPLNGVIGGWTEGVQLMKEGDKFEFFIPYDLAYGTRGSGRNIPPYAALIFTIELISIDS